MRSVPRRLLLPVLAAGALGAAAAAPAAAHDHDARFLLRMTNAGGPADLNFAYGVDDDTAVVGDFNGDGTQTVGVRRGDRYFIRNGNSGGPADLDFHFGRADDTPVVGDWNGDGTQTVGVRRGDRFFLRNSNSGGPADLDFRFGRSGDVPVVGDWNGDGVETVGVRRGGTFYLRNSNSGGPADLAFAYGGAEDTALVGDWNGNGTTTVGVHRVPRPEPEPEVRTQSEWPDVPGTPPADDRVWVDLARCESNNNWQAVSANGLYYGGLQFHPDTWRSVGGSGLPNQASRAEQIHRAQLLLSRPWATWGNQWPACSRMLGLS
jgi:hypothetical protein